MLGALEASNSKREGPFPVTSRLEVNNEMSKLFFPLVVSCQPSTEDAIKYNDGITEQQILVNEKVSELQSSYDSYESSEMDKAFKKVQDQLKNSIEYVNKLKGFEDDVYFKEGALEFFNTYKNILENEHKRIIELYKLPDDEYGTKEVEELQDLRDLANKRAAKVIDDMLIVQKKFAEKYHIELETEQE